MTHALRKITAPLWGAVLIVAACSGGDDDTPTGPGPGPGDPGAGNPLAVAVNDNFYDPNATTIATGSTVRWTWNGGNNHSVTFDAGGTNSTVKSAGTFDRTFPTAGQFTYFCTVHGKGIMSGTVTVQ